ncbi:hypothetical protein, partial [uncultured Gammaproteobacteria bacterium]
WLVMAFISIIFYSLLYINSHLMAYFLLLLFFLSITFWL